MRRKWEKIYDKKKRWHLNHIFMIYMSLVFVSNQIYYEIVSRGLLSVVYIREIIMEAANGDIGLDSSC